MCPSGCANIRFDPLNCGACGTVCPSPSDGVAECDEGSCTAACNAGFRAVGSRCVAIAAPRQIAPASTATVTSRRPTLRWELAAGTDGARVELCADRACTRSIETLDAAGASAQPTADLPPGVVFWRLSARSGGSVTTSYGPTWEFFVGPRSAAHDTSFGSRFDVNGDGFADLAVSARGDTTHGGRVYVFHGSAAGVATTPAVTLFTGTIGESFGRAVAAGGDVNGDGYGDLLAVSQQSLYYSLGGPSGLRTVLTVGMARTLDPTVVGVGDLDRDGYADILTDAFPMAGGAVSVCFGSIGGPVCDGSRDSRFSFPARAATVTDFNGDEYADLVATSEGAVFGFAGRPGGPSGAPTLEFRSEPSSSTFGASLAGDADVDGDGFPDLVIGDPRTLQSRVYEYLGAACPDGTYDGILLRAESANADIGTSVALADLNGDGYSDLIEQSGSAAAVIVNGGPAGLGSTPTQMLTTASAVAPLRAVGDLNGDGYEDAIQTTFDRVFVYYGSATGLPSAPSTMIPAPEAMIGFTDAV
jgi:hypothetical protein